MSASVLDDHRVEKTLRQQLRVAYRHDSVVTPHHVERWNRQLVREEVRVLWCCARETANHDGQVERYGRRYGIAESRKQPCERSTLTEAEDPVKALRRKKIDRPVTCSLPPAKAVVPPAEVTRREGRRIDEDQFNVGR